MRPFRFEAAWLTHDDFPNFARHKWGLEGGEWCHKVCKFQQDLKKWNHEVFGCIGKKKKELLGRLSWLDYQRSHHNNRRLETEYKMTWKEYETVLAQDEIMWFQKSRARWLQYGDCNTRYFHGVTAVRRMKNIYDMLKGDDGAWIKESSQLEYMVTNYYKTLFQDDEQFSTLGLSGVFPTLDEGELLDLGRRVFRAEIFQTVKRMGSFKAPGPDGYQAIFYQNQWQVIGNDFCELVIKIFEDPIQVKAINETSNYSDS